MYYKGQVLDGGHGRKGKLMDKIRAALEQDERFRDRVPRADVLSGWINEAIEERLKEGPDKDHSGDGDGRGGENPGVMTESALRTEVDGYIYMSKEAMKESAKAKKGIELQESMGQASYSACTQM